MLEAAEVHYQAAIRQIKRICISLLDTECNFAYFWSDFGLLIKGSSKATCFVGEVNLLEAKGEVEEAVAEAAKALLSNNLSLGEAELLRRLSCCNVGTGGGRIILSC